MALRLWPLLATTPIAHPDEFNAVYWPLLVALGDPSPAVLYYPHLHFYLVALLHVGRWAAYGLAGGDLALRTWLGVQYFFEPGAALATARWVSALCGCATVWVVGRLAWATYGRGAQLPAMALAAVAVVHVRQSPLAGLDVPMALWFAAAVWAAVRLLEDDGAGRYARAGALVGVAAATKYHGALAGGAVVAAHLLARRGALDRRLWLAGGAALAAFIVGSPFVVLHPRQFVGDFGRVVENARTGLADLGPGWLYHVTFSLRHNLGWLGLAAAGAGIGAAIGARPHVPGRAAARVVAAAFVVYYLVLGASPLVFVRYALPLAVLQCVLAVGGLRWLGRRLWREREGPLVALGVALVALPALYASARVADLLGHRDTRGQAAAWIEAHVANGATLCNFGGWPGDPPLQTVSGTWWELRRFVEALGEDRMWELLPDLERSGSAQPTYDYALAKRWTRPYEAGSERAVEEFACDYVVVNRHPLSGAAVDTTFAARLPETARLEARFEPRGKEAAWPVYDSIDAYYVPLAGFGGLRQPGPSVEVWRVAGARPPAPRAWSVRELLSRAMLRGAVAALEEGREGDFRALAGTAAQLSTEALDGGFYRRLGWVYRRLGEPEVAAARWRRALELDPGATRLWLELGLLYAGELGDREGAVSCFARVLAAAPDHPKATLLRRFIAGG